MTSFRSFLHAHRTLAALLLACALAMKALVPAGYMVGSQSRTIAIQICDGQDHHILGHIVVGDAGKGGNGQNDHAKGDGVCPYGALGHASLASADPVQLALALAFILAVSFAALVPTRQPRLLHIRPPLRGPPSQARPT